MEREKLASLSAQVQSDLARAVKTVSSSSGSPPSHHHKTPRSGGDGGEESIRSKLMFFNFTGGSGDH